MFLSNCFLSVLIFQRLTRSDSHKHFICGIQLQLYSCSRKALLGGSFRSLAERCLGLPQIAYDIIRSQEKWIRTRMAKTLPTGIPSCFLFAALGGSSAGVFKQNIDAARAFAFLSVRRFYLRSVCSEEFRRMRFIDNFFLHLTFVIFSFSFS